MEEDNVKIDIREIMWEFVSWTHLAQDIFQWWALVITVMNLQMPFKTENFLTS
jgi:hypothetical protein